VYILCDNRRFDGARVVCTDEVRIWSSCTLLLAKVLTYRLPLHVSLRLGVWRMHQTPHRSSHVGGCVHSPVPALETLILYTCCGSLTLVDRSLLIAVSLSCGVQSLYLQLYGCCVQLLRWTHVMKWRRLGDFLCAENFCWHTVYGGANRLAAPARISCYLCWTHPLHVQAGRCE
jgi:hypothetical protein